MDYDITLVTASAEHQGDLHLTIVSEPNTKATHKIRLTPAMRTTEVRGSDTVMRYQARGAQLDRITQAELELDPEGDRYMQYKYIQIECRANNLSALFSSKDTGGSAGFIESRATLTPASESAMYQVVTYTNNFTDAGKWWSVVACR